MKSEVSGAIKHLAPLWGLKRRPFEPMEKFRLRLLAEIDGLNRAPHSEVCASFFEGATEETIKRLFADKEEGDS